MSAERERICAFVEQEAQHRRELMLAHADAGNERSAQEYKARWQEARDLALRIRNGAYEGAAHGLVRP